MSVFVDQIGDGNEDHHFWGRPEDMTMNRPCYRIGPGKPGSDVAGEWAAALAAAYLVFKDKGGECTLQRQHVLY